jgi:deoxyribose-phosphate aldolase
MTTVRDAVAEMTVETVTRVLDHIMLAPDQTFSDIEIGCHAAAEHGLASVCLPPYAVSLAAHLLRGSGVAVCGAVGVPLGHSGLKAKSDEAATSIEAGAGQIDMAINMVAMKSSRFGDVQAEIAAIRKLAQGLVLKVTLECCYLTDAEKVRASKLAIDAGADVIKTHTGFGRSGATLRDVQLLSRVLGRRVELEAAGGITRFKPMHAMLQAGATRIGSDKAIALLEDFFKWEIQQ